MDSLTAFHQIRLNIQPDPAAFAHAEKMLLMIGFAFAPWV
jgi:hypothetical protein